MAADPFVSTGHAPDWSRRWTRRLFDAGLLVPGWPPEWGGRNLGPVETLVYMEELAKAGLPRTGNVQGLGIIAPSIIDYGTPEQIEQYALPILRGEQTACLGMSEPGAGSDLAALSTRAVREGARVGPGSPVLPPRDPPRTFFDVRQETVSPHRAGC